MINKSKSRDKESINYAVSKVNKTAKDVSKIAGEVSRAAQATARLANEVSHSAENSAPKQAYAPKQKSSSKAFDGYKEIGKAIPKIEQPKAFENEILKGFGVNNQVDNSKPISLVPWDKAQSKKAQAAFLDGFNPDWRQETGWNEDADADENETQDYSTDVNAKLNKKATNKNISWNDLNVVQNSIRKNEKPILQPPSQKNLANFGDMTSGKLFTNLNLSDKINERLSADEAFKDILFWDLKETKENIVRQQKLERENIKKYNESIVSYNEPEYENLYDMLETGYPLTLFDAIAPFLKTKGNEIENALSDIPNTLEVLEAKNIAGRARQHFFQYNTDGSKNPYLNHDGARANAFLHAYWSSLIAYRTGKKNAIVYTINHEIMPKYKIENDGLNEPVAKNVKFTVRDDIYMDLNNNIVGINLINALPDDEEEVNNQLLAILGSEENIKQHLKDLKISDRKELLLLFMVLEKMENGSQRNYKEDGELYWLYG